MIASPCSQLTGVVAQTRYAPRLHFSNRRIDHSQLTWLPCPAYSLMDCLPLSHNKLTCLLSSHRNPRNERSQPPPCLPTLLHHERTAYGWARTSRDFACKSLANSQIRAAPLPTPLPKTLVPPELRLDEAQTHLTLLALYCLLPHPVPIRYSVPARLAHQIRLLVLHHLLTTARTAVATTWRRPFQLCPVDLSRTVSYLHPRASTPSGVLAATRTCYRVLLPSKLQSCRTARALVATTRRTASERRPRRALMLAARRGSKPDRFLGAVYIKVT